LRPKWVMVEVVLVSYPKMHIHEGAIKTVQIFTNVRL